MTATVARILAAATTAVLASTALANELVVGVATEPTSMDPQYQALGSNEELSLHLFEALIERGPEMELKPALATSWAPTDDPLVWEFKLRDDVTFHNGEPFTAHDVVFSLERALDVPNAPSTFKRRLVKVTKSWAVDDHTLHVQTETPYPLLPRYLAAVYIVSKGIGDGTESTTFNDGTNTHGTGRYKFTEFVPGDHATFTANENYYGDRPHWDKVTFRWLESGPSRVAALLSGDVDAIATVPTTDVDRLRDNPDINVSCGVTSRLIYWSLDVSSEQAAHITAKDGSAIPNPLADVRVRKAFSMAMDRSAIVDNVMGGLAVPTGQIVFEALGGYNPDIAVPEFDVAGAKALLAEAGYPDGFKLTIHATNDRYVNDAKLAQAVAQMLTRIGVDVTVETMPVAVYYGKARKHEFTMAQIGWSTASGESSAILHPALASGQRNNYGRWENAEFNQQLEAALSTVDLEQYEKSLQAATRVAVEEDVAIIPTHIQVLCSASRKELAVTPRIDELMLAESVRRQ